MTLAGGGWGGGGVEEEDTGSGLGGAQATSGSGWGQAEPDQASLVHLDLQFAALVRCSGRKVQMCPVMTAQSQSAQKSKAWSYTCLLPRICPLHLKCIVVTGFCLLKGPASRSIASIRKLSHASALLHSSRACCIYFQHCLELQILQLIGKAIRFCVSYSSKSTVSNHIQMAKPSSEPMLLLYRHTAAIHGVKESHTMLSTHQARSTTVVLHGAMTKLVATTGKAARRAVGPRREPSRRQQPSTCRALSSLQLVASRYGVCSL